MEDWFGEDANRRSKSSADSASLSVSKRDLSFLYKSTSSSFLAAFFCLRDFLEDVYYNDTNTVSMNPLILTSQAWVIPHRTHCCLVAQI